MKHIASKNTSSSLTEVQESDVQPNAVDLKLGKIFKIKTDEFVIDEEHKQHRGSEAVQVQEDGYYHLEPGDYEVIMQNEISVGPNEAGFVITRSTLNRNSVFLTSGLYDSKYIGVMAAVMHVGCGTMKIKPGTRVGQYIMWESEMLGKGYDGSYGHGKSHDKKYNA